MITALLFFGMVDLIGGYLCVSHGNFINLFIGMLLFIAGASTFIVGGGLIMTESIERKIRKKKEESK